jgi:hypothetical protein
MVSGKPLNAQNEKMSFDANLDLAELGALHAFEFGRQRR